MAKLDSTINVNLRLAGEDLDRRYFRDGVTLYRAEGNDKAIPAIVGLAAVYYDEADPGTEFQLDVDFFERIMPGAFARALTEKDDVRALFNHDTNYILGRTAAETLKLSRDRRGLAYKIFPPDNAQGRFVTDAIERGDVTGSSFGFVVDEQVLRTEKRDDMEVLIREIVSVSLFDVSPVTFPAYASTTAGVMRALMSQRSLDAIEQDEVYRQFRAKRDDVGSYPTELAKLKRLLAST